MAASFQSQLSGTIKCAALIASAGSAEFLRSQNDLLAALEKMLEQPVLVPCTTPPLKFFSNRAGVLAALSEAKVCAVQATPGTTTITRPSPEGDGKSACHAGVVGDSETLYVPFQPLLFTITMRDGNDAPVPMSKGQTLIVETMTNGALSVLPTVDHGDGTHTFTWLIDQHPACCGGLSLSVTLDGQHVSNSPLKFHPDPFYPGFWRQA
eukprot:NODE_999_length_1768_cov_25.609657_g882_i0.p1 GENE.NODE_999_length_1768_cov_25.609657_g882_i0~~NODE_999_length_1768_cov_25.609657_g882_i0.p1  ORF type:complete len:209 (+),score=27.35 NODE_999_length_1768_cov_25.609657_g882_i0:632-1258(+)